MDISFEQRQLLSSLYKYGYIGNWYRTPNKTFLKVYLTAEKKDVHIRVQFGRRLNIIEVMFDDPTIPLFHKSEFESKFSNVFQAIKEVSPDAFKDYAISSNDLDDKSGG